MVFGGRKLFEQLKRKHLSGKARERLRREWKEKRQGFLYSRGDATKKGNANLRLESRDGALWLRVNLGNSAHVQALVKTSHPQLKALIERAYAFLPYNVTLQLKDGKVYAHFTWSEGVPPPVHTKANGVLGIDVNADPYHLALAVVGKDGNLIRHLTLSLVDADNASGSGSGAGTTWTLRNPGNTLFGVTYGKGLFVAVGAKGTILTSRDGVSWTLRNSGTSRDLFGVAYGNGRFVVVGEDGTILTSPDGVSWTARTSGTSKLLNGVTYGNGTFVAVGDYGTILTSP
ncbi:hypothetical protein BVI061214_02360 [Thermus aquaticus]|uniref:Uncharacterized protein n=1 Tax=Thermus aquaticus TaxID=271 RepID=A0A0M9ABY1_THEAQ|nr:hypothetical protein [Thermus aquaticus]KOX88937.1 hypothetical protein BVI061214_02360 [Thermus aquaticus]